MTEGKNDNQSPALDISSPKLLIKAAQAILGEAAVPNLSGKEKRQVQHARILLNAAMRELEYGPSLKALDAHSQEQFGFNSQAELVEKISEGEITPSLELKEYLKRRTLLQLTIDNPNYWGYLEAKQRWSDNG